MAIKKTINIGMYVSITPKNKNSQSTHGMIKRIIKKSSKETIVELVDGTIGTVLKPLVMRASTRAIKVFRSDLKKHSSNEKSKKARSNEALFSGENELIEYKLSALWSQNLSKKELDELKTSEIKRYGNKTSKIILAKVISSFLNTRGGNLIIGIKEEKEHGRIDKIIGIEEEFKKLRNRDYGTDGYRRMIIDDIIKPYFPKTIFNHFNNYFTITFLEREGKILCNIEIKKSDHHVFITIDGKDHFFI